MPRRAPDGKGVTEHRITFGNYERAFVTEVKEDIEAGIKIAAVSAVAVPVAVGASAVIGLGLLGYGIYRGLDAFSFGLGGITKDEIKCEAKNFVKTYTPAGWLWQVFSPIEEDCKNPKKEEELPPDAAGPGYKYPHLPAWHPDNIGTWNGWSGGGGGDF
jgi:hypothetical protein